MEKSHNCKDHTAAQYLPFPELLANSNYLIFRNLLWILFSVFLCEEKSQKQRLTDLSKVKAGDIRCLSCAQETEHS